MSANTSGRDLLTIDQVEDAIVMTITVKQVDATLLTRIERESTSMSARGLKRPVMLKMDHVETVSSVMMGALLALLRKLKQRGLRMILVGLNDNIRGTFKLTHLDRMFEIFESVEEAQGAMRRHARL